MKGLEDSSSDSEEEFKAKGVIASSDEEPSEEDESEEEDFGKKAKTKRASKPESKKRTRDGKPKKEVKEKPKEAMKQDKNKPKGLEGKPKEKDDGKKMMNEKEAKAAVKDYMIKVRHYKYIIMHSKIDHIPIKMLWIIFMAELRNQSARKFWLTWQKKMSCNAKNTERPRFI